MVRTSATRSEEAVSFLNRIGGFLYRSQDGWRAFPAWARYFLQLGTALSSYDDPHHRFVVGLTIPVRAFASVLLASGIIIPRIGLAQAADEEIDPHIAQLEALPVGTSIVFRRNDRKYKGIYRGTSAGFGKRYFKINFQAGTEIHIPYEDAYKIEVAAGEVTRLPKLQSGRPLGEPSVLARYLLQAERFNRYVAESRLECLILGQQNLLRQELCNFPVAWRSAENVTAPGTLLDMVKVKGAQFQRPGLSYRSYVLPSSARYSPDFASRLRNYITVFDNPLSFIKWRSSFGNSNWLVVLDKTDRNFDLAVGEINQEYVQNRIAKRTKWELPAPPAGIDQMIFEVSR